MQIFVKLFSALLKDPVNVIRKILGCISFILKTRAERFSQLTTNESCYDFEKTGCRLRRKFLPTENTIHYRSTFALCLPEI